jgi:cyclophilin family peptidyl-prolyl cis-trans isomerase
LAVGALLAAGGCGGDSEAGGKDGKPAAAIDGSAEGGTAGNPSEGGQDGPSLAAPSTDPLHPAVQIETSLGNIVVELDAEKAGLTVGNFLRYVEEGHYDGTIFHQVFRDYVVLGGGYTPDLTEKPAHDGIYNEAHNGLKNVRGTIAMARQPDVVDSATSQFFINCSDNPMLDHKDRTSADTYGYCVFGKVIRGMDVVDKIAAAQVTDRGDFEQIPVQPVLIQSVRQIR